MLGDFDEVRHACQHPADLRPIRQRVAVADPAESEVFRAIRALNATAEEPRQVASVVLDMLTAELDCAGGLVAMLDGTALSVIKAVGTLAELTGQSYPTTDSLASRAIAERRVLLHNASTIDGLGERFASRFGISRAAVAPLVASGTPVGAVLAVNPRARDFSESDASFIARLADIGALGIQNAWLLARARQQAHEAAALADIVQQLNQSLEFERVARLVAEQSTELLGGRGAALVLFDGDEAHVAGAVGVAERLAGVRRPAEGSLARSVATDRRVVRTTNLQQWSGRQSVLDLLGPGPTAAIVAPLLVADRPIGALFVAANPGHEYGQRDEELLQSLASHAAVAIENARLYRAAAHTARHAETLSSAARSLSHAVDASGFFDALSRVAHDLLGAAGLTVYAIDSATQSVRIRHVEGIGADVLIKAASRLEDATEVAALLVRGVEGFFEDVRSEQEPNLWKATLGSSIPEAVVSLARLPLLVEGRVRGALALRWSSRHAFPDDERVLLRDFATQVALALRNAEQFDAERRSREVAEAAAVIARSGLGTTNAVRTATLALEAIDRAVPSPGKAIALVDDSGTVLRYLAASGTLSALNQVSVPIAQSGATASVPLSVQRVNPAILGRIAEGSVVREGSILIPLIVREQLLGILWAVPATMGPSADAELETLRNLAASLALAADVLLLSEEETKRRAREHMLATALATMDQAVLIIGLDRRVLYANAAAVTEYGYPFDSVRDLPFDRLVDSAAVARRVGPDATSEEPSGVWEAEHIHRRRDGSTFPASVLLSYIRDAKLVPIGQVVTVRNLTAERRIEEQLRQSEKLAALGELVAGVAHELNNPLAGISAFAQLLMEDPLNDEQQESVRLIKREADRAVGVIRDLLLFSRKTGPTQTLVDINEMVELTLRLRGYGLRSAGIDVRVELDPTVPRVAGDSQRLQQVLLNLIINAEYALQRADVKRLVVRSERTRDGVALLVQDSGPGIDEETRQRMFEPFFTTKPAGEGTGLGLSVSYGIVRAHGGFISVESAAELGTRFRVELPQAREQSSLASA